MRKIIFMLYALFAMTSCGTSHAYVDDIYVSDSYTNAHYGYIIYNGVTYYNWYTDNIYLNDTPVIYINGIYYYQHFDAALQLWYRVAVPNHLHCHFVYSHPHNYHLGGFYLPQPPRHNHHFSDRRPPRPNDPPIHNHRHGSYARPGGNPPHHNMSRPGGNSNHGSGNNGVRPSNNSRQPNNGSVGTPNNSNRRPSNATSTRPSTNRPQPSTRTNNGGNHRQSGGHRR